MKKSQTAIEFVVLVGVVLFIFTTFMLVVQDNVSQQTREKQQIAIREIAMTVQDEINLASSSSEGYRREFLIPDKVGSIDYNLITDEGMVYITLESIAIALPIVQFNGTVIKGTNIIKKENGEVHLNV